MSCYATVKYYAPKLRFAKTAARMHGRDYHAAMDMKLS